MKPKPLPYTFTDDYGGRCVVTAMESHRNGIGGEPYILFIIDRQTGDATGLFLAWMHPSAPGRSRAETVYCTQISRLPDIEFAAGNSWRGSDMFGAGLNRLYEEVYS